MNLTTAYGNSSDSVGAAAVVKVTDKDGVFHKDTGYGAIENAKGKGVASEAQERSSS